MERKTILTCAVTGGAAWPRQHPDFPITPKQIAKSGLDAAKAGAAVLHIHARDIETGHFALDVALYREIMERIRDENSDVILNFTTGWGGMYMPSTQNLAVAGPGTSLLTAEERVVHIVELRPEICSLDLNTMQMGNVVDGEKSMPMIMMNVEPVVSEMARLIRGAGVKPEIEIFEAGDLVFAEHLIKSGALDGPGYYTIVLGLGFGMPPTPEAMLYARNCLPQGAIWTGMGISRLSLPMAAQSYILGGNVRVGLEDNLYLGKGRFATNAELVTQAREVLEPMGMTLATPKEARKTLGLAA